jgi:hypothetical protein
VNVTANTATEEAKFAPVTLEGNVIRLEPMRLAHAGLLWQAAQGSIEEIFRWYP